MALVSVKDILQEEGLKYPALSVLEANEALYTTLLIQPKASIFVSDQEIRNNDLLAAQNLSINAMSLARQNDVDLFVMPEYSVPWAAVETELNAGGGPRQGQIWVMGCESISINDVLDIKQRFSQWAVVIHEPIERVQIEPRTANYFNPIIYLFRTLNQAGTAERLVMLVQFKTHPSGDPANTEVTYMAKGKQIYMFDGGRSEVRLLTFICSDVLGLNEADLDECYEDSLILHVQLNDNPRASAYTSYKRRLFMSRCDRTELICLNWAENIEFHIAGTANSIQKNNIGGSVWHSRSDQLDTTDTKVESNQRLGLYYTRDDNEKRHVLHFSYEPAAFLLRATKVKHTAVRAAQSYRRGPEVDRVFTWNSNPAHWLPRQAPVDDGFGPFCKGYDTPSAADQLILIHENSPLAAERIVEIGSGAFSARPNWYHSHNLETARVDAAEIVNRITVTHDPESPKKRNDLIACVQALSQLSGSIPFKAPLEDVQRGYKFAWSSDHPNCNVVPLGDNPVPATIVYGGVGRRPDELQALYAKTSQFAKLGTKPDRYCVVYQEGVHVKVYTPSVRNPITSAGTATSNDFTEPEK